MTNLVGPGTSGTSGTPLSHGCGRCKVGRTQRRLPEQESQLEALQRPGAWPGPGCRLLGEISGSSMELFFK